MQWPYGLLYFEKYFTKYILLFLLTLNRLKRDQITICKKCRKEILNINSLVTPCLTNGYFSGQYKIILEFLNDYDKAKIT